MTTAGHPVWADMHGWTGTTAPTSGLVAIPDHIDPTNFNRTYDLDDPAERKYLYEIVLTDGTPDDAEHLIHRSHLASLWDRLYLPRQVRSAWEAHPDVRQRPGPAACEPRDAPIALGGAAEAR